MLEVILGLLIFCLLVLTFNTVVVVTTAAAMVRLIERITSEKRVPPG